MTKDETVTALTMLGFCRATHPEHEVYIKANTHKLTHMRFIFRRLGRDKRVKCSFAIYSANIQNILVYNFNSYSKAIRKFPKFFAVYQKVCALRD